MPQALGSESPVRLFYSHRRLYMRISRWWRIVLKVVVMAVTMCSGISVTKDA